jgi:hypothetical protein
MTESWRPIHDFPAYEVSDLGRVRRITPARGGPSMVGRPLKPGNVGGGYQMVALYNDFGRLQAKVHRLVLEAFVGPAPQSMPHCAHGDGDPRNNRLTNLRWDSVQGNLADRVAHGTEIRGARNGRTKLSAEAVAEIRRRYKPRCRVNGANVMAKEFGVTDVAIIKAARGENWSHLPV